LLFFFFGFCGGEGRGWRRRGYWPPDERGCGGAAMILRKREGAVAGAAVNKGRVLGA